MSAFETLSLKTSLPAPDPKYDRWTVPENPHSPSPGSANFADTSAHHQLHYITTAINYANGAAHMGHAYEGVTADVISRAFRMGFKGDNSGGYFLTGSDEHGQKIAGVAEKEGKEPIEVCDQYVRGFQSLNYRMRISNDDYLRTTSERHKNTAREIWRRCGENGDDIFLGSYEGWYNVREEAFVTENEAALTGYKDETSGKPLEKVSEPSYFFRMGRYQERLVHHIQENPLFVQPAGVRKEILARLKEPLRDLSISRTTFNWGIKVPEGWDQKHVMYVWFDALSNYATGVDLFGLNEDGGTDGREKMWPPQIHLIGKDIIWFHVVIWPCMLMSAGVDLPKTIFAHGFINDKDGNKMSKTLNNGIDPHEMLDKFDNDTFRWYLCKEPPFGKDLSFSEKSLEIMHNDELCDKLGNLVHRVTNLTGKFCEGLVPDVEGEGVEGGPFDVNKLREDVKTLMEEYKLKDIAQSAIDAVASVNQYLTDSAPWKVKGDDPEATKSRQKTIRTSLEAIYVFSHFLAPFIPQAATKIFEMLNTPYSNVEKLAQTNNLMPGTAIIKGDILFNKIVSDEEKSAAERKVEKAREAAENQKRKKKEREEKAAMARAGDKAAKAATDDDQPDFTKMDIRIGKVTKVWVHQAADKLYCEEIDVGEDEPRQIASGLRSFYSLEEMEGRMVCVVCNLKASKIVGFNSNGMVLAGKSADGSVTELVDPPVGATIGERVYIEGQEGEPQSSNVIKKRKTWDTVKKNLKVDGNKNATHDNLVFRCQAGPCTVVTLDEGSPIM